MRHRSLPARAFYRLLSGQQQQSSSATTSSAAAASSATAQTTATSPSSSSSATTETTRVVSRSPTSTRLSRAAAVARRRQDAVNSGSAAAQGTMSSSSSSFTRRRRSVSKRAPSGEMMVVSRDSVQSWHDLLRGGSGSIAGSSGIATPLRLQGITPVAPPETSLSNVALQNFFAAQRPLLEHSVVDAESGLADAESDEQGAGKMASRMESVKNTILQHLHDEGHMSANDMKNATVVFATLGESPLSPSFAKRVDNLEQSRFVSLLDRLSGIGQQSSGSDSPSSSNVVRREAQSLADEYRHRSNVETAVHNALERGEDPTVAKALGSEADLVILGEPDGPNPAWARGVATHLAQAARAYEPPAAPSKDGEASGAVSTYKVYEEREDREDDTNLLLSHAMVQATLPPALSWDRLVAKMDAATLGDEAVPSAVNVRLLNSDVRHDSEDADDATGGVAMDSTKRKRRKKMRKHKYRKLRKATRTERRRLKQ